MARLPPLWMQNGSYAAAVDRRLIGTVWPNGGSLGHVVTVTTGTMNTSVAAGTTVVPDSRISGAAYLCSSDAPEAVAIPQAPPAGQDRIDLIVVRPRDSQYAGADTDWIFDVVQGAPAANPVEPVAPVGTRPLASQRVVGGSASITAANLADRRASLGNLSVRPSFGHATRGDTSLPAGDQSLLSAVVPAPSVPSTIKILAYGFMGFGAGVTAAQFNIRRNTVNGPVIAYSSPSFNAAATVRGAWIIGGRTTAEAGEAVTIHVMINPAQTQWTNTTLEWEVHPR
jgi:hypothetical protein